MFIILFYPDFLVDYLLPGHRFFPLVPLFLLLISVKYVMKQFKLLGLIFALVVMALMGVELSLTQAALIYLIASVLLAWAASNYFKIWVFLKNGSEIIANSWKEWEFGKIRVINHGFYVGFGSFLGILLIGYLVGDDYAWGVLIFSLVVIVFSALWAQVIEGSEKLKRPFGYYGALVGIIFASMVVWLMGYDVWVIIGVVSVVMPWVQAIGRFRCLVNGCCHGSKVKDSSVGIRYHHYRSRVCGLSDLKGELLHPTQLYAMLWLFLVGLVLLSLWNNNFSSSFIFGIYLILTGIGRFVEEAYRGEVQTHIIMGLRLYQWTAIISVLIGIGMTMIPVEAFVKISEFGWESIVAASIGGLFTFFVMGVDFPQSNKRFSRLV